MYLRLKIPEVHGLMYESSKERLCLLKKHNRPNNKEDVIEMLSDKGGKNYNVFQDTENDDKEIIVKTIAVGIFDLCNKTWSLYADRPNSNEPMVVLPLLCKPTKK